MISITCLRPAKIVSVRVFLSLEEGSSLSCQLADDFVDVSLDGGLEEAMGGEEC